MNHPENAPQFNVWNLTIISDGFSLPGLNIKTFRVEQNLYWATNAKT